MDCHAVNIVCLLNHFPCCSFLSIVLPVKLIIFVIKGCLRSCYANIFWETLCLPLGYWIFCIYKLPSGRIFFIIIGDFLANLFFPPFLANTSGFWFPLCCNCCCCFHKKITLGCTFICLMTVFLFCDLDLHSDLIQGQMI